MAEQWLLAQLLEARGSPRTPSMQPPRPQLRDIGQHELATKLEEAIQALRSDQESNSSIQQEN